MDIDNSKLMAVPTQHFIPMQYPYDQTIIYVRDCYPRYLSILWNDLFVDNMNSVLISGTPGIGKSIFYIYVLQMMKQHLGSEFIKVIVLASFYKGSKLKSCVILEHGKEPIFLEKGKPIQEFENAVYLCDGIPEIVHEGKFKTIIFASPNRDFLKNHSKNATMSKRFMPLWSESEIYEAADLLGLDLSQDFIKHLIFRFGGSVRYIFSNKEKFRQEGIKEQGKAIASIESFDYLKKCLNLMSDEDIIHRVFYIVPSMDIDQSDCYEMHFGSVYIASSVEANLKTAEEQERLKLFRWLQSHGKSRSTAGWVFESYCHGFLSSGLNSVARSLTDGVNDLHLEMTSVFHRIAELESIEELFQNMYSAPDITAVDGYYIDNVKEMIYLFKMTISRDHSLALENLIYIMNKFELPKRGFDFALIFVVPLNMAKDFPKQKITAGYTFDDLKNSPVEMIHRIGIKTAKTLRSAPLNISSMLQFYDAAQNESLLQQMLAITSKTCISNFVEIVNGLQQYKGLINIPQFVLGINVEDSISCMKEIQKSRKVF